MLQGGALGLYGDFLIGEENRYGSSALVSLLGPTASNLEGAFKAWGKKFNEDRRDEIPADIINLVKSNTPFANLFYTKHVTDYLIWWRLQELANPGYLDRAQERKEAQGKEFWLKPSELLSK